MSETTIQWTATVGPDGTVHPGFTFNCWIGCTEVSPACANCYARTMSNYRGWAKWGKGEARKRTSAANWRKPLSWNKQAEAAGVRLKVFCASLADYMDAEAPDEWRADLFALIERTPHLDWLLLTKRTESLRPKLPAAWLESPPPNVWLGATVESSAYAWRADHLREVPAAVRFLSCEPLFDDLADVDLTGIHQVIIGGESGGKARPFRLSHARSLMARCREQGIAVFIKQLGARPVGLDTGCDACDGGLDVPRRSHGIDCGGRPLRDSHGGDITEWPADLRIRQFPGDVHAG